MEKIRRSSHMFCMTEPSLAETKKRPNPSVRLLTKPQLQHCLASVHSLTADSTAQIQSGAEGKNSGIIREEAMRGLKCYSSLCREYCRLCSVAAHAMPGSNSLLLGAVLFQIQYNNWRTDKKQHQPVEFLRHFLTNLKTLSLKECTGMHRNAQERTHHHFVMRSQR